MRLVTFLAESGSRAGALLADDSVVDLSLEIGIASIQQLLDGGEPALESARQAIARQRAPLASRECRLLAPIPVPRRNVFCVGKNYREHAIEFGRSGFDAGAQGGDEVPVAPIVFSKPPSSVTGPGAEIPFDADPCGTLDYEGELAVVIGRGGRGISVAEAPAHVAGYTIVNDVTSRELQKRHKQWLLGKGADGFCPMGPALVTTDEIPDVGALRLVTRVNGEIRQEAHLRDLIFTVPELIETISRAITLQPGDVIATGTPRGVGIGFVPPRYLQRGDRVAVSIDGIGTLENEVV
jgi:2-keto-4-pentenoate hydratase/2-oxohepta-3-ene-1,7-dioic acid hydratase in catechol pathway